jgi:L,D-peptidoglycan transpeptidase YkuD (ErfK/YbiS/YcfS/YnhG family)
MHILIKKKNLIFKDYRIKCAVGKRGIGIKRKEGDSVTPKGLFKIKSILYRKDRVKNLKTCLKKITITKKLGWCDDIRSKQYNQLIKFPSKYNSEKLYRVDNIYDIVVVLNYNMNPIVKNKGSAIFIHIAKKNYKSTEGCVAVRKLELIKIIKNLKKNSKVKII